MRIDRFTRTATLFVSTVCLFWGLQAQASTACPEGSIPRDGDTEKVEAIDKACDNTATILDGLKRGDLDPLTELLPSNMRQQAANDLSRSFWMHVGAYGPVEKYAILGGTQDKEGRIQSVARIAFANEEAVFRFVWYQDQLLTFNRIANPAAVVATSAK